MPNIITFAERFQRWNETHKQMQAMHAAAGGAVEVPQEYDHLVSASFECALDVFKARAGCAAEVDQKRAVWEAEEGWHWGAEEIRECMQQVMADAVELAK